MRHVRQSSQACLAYSLLQIGAVTWKQVIEYENMLHLEGSSWDGAQKWLEKYVPWAVASYIKARKTANGEHFTIGQYSNDLSGTGIIVFDVIHGYHAVSFKDGVILDPASDDGTPMSLEECKARGWKVVEIIRK